MGHLIVALWGTGQCRAWSCDTAPHCEGRIRHEAKRAKESVLIKREFPVCEGGGESKVLRSRTSLARNQLRTTPVKAWESMP